MIRKTIAQRAVSVLMTVLLIMTGLILVGPGGALSGIAYAEELEPSVLAPGIETLEPVVPEVTEPEEPEEEPVIMGTTEETKPESAITPCILMAALDSEGNESFDSVSGGSSPFSVNTSWLHYRSDGVVSYSRQMLLDNPDGTGYDYDINDWEPGEEKRLKALFVNADRVATNYGLTGDAKRALIQSVLWAVLSDMVPGNPSSISASTIPLAQAAQSLYSAAYWGWTSESGYVEGFYDDGMIRFSSSFDGNYARFGPFTVYGASSASIKTIDAPVGSYFGTLFGSPVDPDNLPNEVQIYLFIPRTCGTLDTPKVTFNMAYDNFTVTKYSGRGGYKDQFVFEPSGSVEITKTGTCFGFGEVEIVKVDEYTWVALEGAEFIIEEWIEEPGEWVKSKAGIWWDHIKKRYFTGLLSGHLDPHHKYRVREVKAPYSYLATWSMEFSFSNKYGMYYVVNAVNTPIMLEIDVSKVDRNTGDSVPQGDATLEGAVYGLYMNEDIEHPDGTSYMKGQKVAEGTTDKDGKISFEGLFPAKYYIKELSPSKGYLLDDTIYEIDGTHDGANESVVREVIVTEQVKKQRFEIEKIGWHKYKQNSYLAGAGFKVYLISELAGVKDGTLVPAGSDWAAEDFKDYDFTSEQTAKIDGVDTPEFFTYSSGRLVSPELPYGEYVVVETTVPDGYLAADPFLVKVGEDSREAQALRTIVDKEKYSEVPHMGVPKTGDDFNLLLIVVLLLAAAVIGSALIGSAIRKKDLKTSE